MKKSELRKIIKEEIRSVHRRRKKLLKEEVSQFLIDSFIEGVKDAFGEESNLYATKGDEYEKDSDGTLWKTVNDEDDEGYFRW